MQAKSVEIQQLPALNQRSTFSEASAASSNNVEAPPAVQPLPYAGRRRFKTKYIERRNGGRDKVRYRYRYRYRGQDVFF